jgi:hypothetical protein
MEKRSYNFFAEISIMPNGADGRYKRAIEAPFSSENDVREFFKRNWDEFLGVRKRSTRRDSVGDLEYCVYLTEYNI